MLAVLPIIFRSRWMLPQHTDLHRRGWNVMCLQDWYISLTCLEHAHWGKTLKHQRKEYKSVHPMGSLYLQSDVLLLLCFAPCCFYNTCVILCIMVQYAYSLGVLGYPTNGLDFTEFKTFSFKERKSVSSRGTFKQSMFTIYWSLKFDCSNLFILYIHIYCLHMMKRTSENYIKVCLWCIYCWTCVLNLFTLSLFFHLPFFNCPNGKNICWGIKYMINIWLN